MNKLQVMQTEKRSTQHLTSVTVMLPVIINII